ncbi:unnamed protein product [Effrenium voratum]|nr:unnamed protein product [Effrenium voratum]
MLALRIFTVRAEGELPIELQLAQVVEVKKDVAGTPFAKLQELPPPHAVAGVQLKKRVVCLLYGGCDKEQHVLALLMPNQYEQERFYSCMKILRWALEIEAKPRKKEEKEENLETS